MDKSALQELLRVLRSPSSPLQQQQVLNILRSNPPLMAAFIRQRAARHQGGQGGPGGVGGPPQGAPAGVRFQGAAEGHEVKMENSGLGSNNENVNQAAARRLSIQRCIQSLVHACQCRNTDCSLPSCPKMKRVVQHTKGCKRKTMGGGCPICKQLIALCCYHAKRCQEDKCPVPFCLNIKHKLRQQRLQHALRQRGRKTLNRGILCIASYYTESHEVKMEDSGLGSDDENSNQAAAQTSGDARRLSIQGCIQDLIHAVQCRNTDCSLPSCRKMKRVVQHAKICKKKPHGVCPVCKQLIALCCYHSKYCQGDVCPIPLCPSIKRKLRQLRLLRARRQSGNNTLNTG